MNIQVLVKDYIKNGGKAKITKNNLSNSNGITGIGGVLFEGKEFTPWDELSFNSELGFYRRSDHPLVRDETGVNFTTGRIISPGGEGEEDATFYAILPDDFTDGMVIGGKGEVVHLYHVLKKLVETWLPDEEISELDERLGHPWLNPYSAAEFAAEKMGINITPRAINYACQRGRIQGAYQTDTSQWRFPQRSLVGYLASGTGRKRKSRSE